MYDTSEPQPEPTPLAYDFGDAHPWYPCPEGEVSPDAVEVPLFTAAEQAYFVEPPARELYSTVDLPVGSWSQVGLRLDLSCPEGGRCDAWDREASLRLLGPEAGDLELLRYVTPYGEGMCGFVDITPLADRLVGQQTFESWIDTWVGPGHSDGDGWVVDATLVFLPGVPERVVESIPVWTRQRVVVGDPSRPVADQLPAVAVELPDDAVRVEARVTTTGHGFGFDENCAEFCKLDNVVSLGSASVVSDPWRKNCEKNPVSDQAGTWLYDRNGWCPGAVANPKTLDLTPGAAVGAQLALDIVLRDGTAYVDDSGRDGDPFVDVSVVLLVERAVRP